MSRQDYASFCMVLRNGLISLHKFSLVRNPLIIPGKKIVMKPVGPRFFSFASRFTRDRLQMDGTSESNLTLSFFYVSHTFVTLAK